MIYRHYLEGHCTLESKMQAYVHIQILRVTVSMSSRDAPSTFPIPLVSASPSMSIFKQHKYLAFQQGLKPMHRLNVQFNKGNESQIIHTALLAVVAQGTQCHARSVTHLGSVCFRITLSRCAEKQLLLQPYSMRFHCLGLFSGSLIPRARLRLVLCAIVLCVTASAMKSHAVGLERKLLLGTSAKSDAKTHRTKMGHRSSMTLSTLCDYCQ